MASLARLFIEGDGRFAASLVLLVMLTLGLYSDNRDEIQQSDSTLLTQVVDIAAKPFMAGRRFLFDGYQRAFPRKQSSYMAAAGLPKPCEDHAQRCVRTGLKMVEFLEQRNETAEFVWSIRVGVNSGPVVAGVVGKRKYAFDIWGDTVNVASRMESAGQLGRVNISASTYGLIRADFDCEYRGKLDAKGMGQTYKYFVKAPRRLDADSSML